MDDFIEKFREFRQRASVPNLPVNPNWISAFSVIVSFGVWWNPIIAIASALTLDLLDGMVAGGAGRDGGSREGKLTDWACDRYSEFVIFGYFSTTTLLTPALAALPVLNTIVTILAAGDRKIPVLPLRHILLLYLLLRA